jgi:hypothetical protein
MPTSQVPANLEARVATWHAVPVVEVVLQHSEESPGAGSTRVQGTGRSVPMTWARRDPGELSEVAWPEVGQGKTHAVVEYVVKRG